MIVGTAGHIDHGKTTLVRAAARDGMGSPSARRQASTPRHAHVAGVTRVGGKHVLPTARVRDYTPKLAYADDCGRYSYPVVRLGFKPGMGASAASW